MAAKEHFSPDGSDWHESGVAWDADVAGLYDVVCTRADHIPPKEVAELHARDWEFVIRPLRMGGKAWLIEPLRALQPKSFAVLEAWASGYKLGFSWYDPFMREPPEKESMIFYGWLEVCGRIVSIDTLRGTYEEDTDYCRDSLRALPEALARSWLWRGGGWAIHNSLPGTPILNRQLIGHPSGQWQSIAKLLRSYGRGWDKKHMPVILGQLPEAIVTHYNPYDNSPSQWHALRCFLDTRPEGLAGPCGDQLLVLDCRTDQTVYHIHDGDFKHIRILHDPAEAIDAYCAHTLLRTPGRFDFMPWSEPR